MSVVTDTMKETITNEFFSNEAAKIRRMSDSILKKIGYVTDYPDEFYSLAGEVFLSVIDSWDGNRKFESYLYSCLSNRFKSYLTKANAQKRGGVDKPDVSLYQEIGDDLTLEDTIGNEQIIDRLSPEMVEYIESLNATQKSIYLMLSQGYEPNEIQEKLGITSKIYNRELRDARAYDKIKIFSQAKVVKKPSSKEIIATTVQDKKGSNDHMAKTNERTDVTKTVSMLIEDVADGTLRDDNPLQRATDNWNSEMKGNLIVTMLNGYGIPNFVLCQRKVGNTAVLEIIDGLQRYSTVSSYIANGYRISKNVERPIVVYNVWKEDSDGNKIVEDGLPVYEEKTFDVRGKKFVDLPRELQKRIEGYGIHCDTYLNCTNEDVEYHIRRLNASRSMNHSQRGLTFIGSTFAAKVKEISRKNFFRDTYKATDFKNGNIQRLISESVMLINFPGKWVSSPEKLGAYLSKNADENQFEYFSELVDRVYDILDDDTSKLFNMRDSFLWFKVFNDFTKIGIEDDRFNDFLKEFDTLQNTEIDGDTFASLNTKNTKAASAIQKKINYLETLMYKYLGVEKEDEFDLQYGNDIAEFIEDFYSVEVTVPVVAENRAKVAIKTALALKGIDKLSDTIVQESLDEEKLSSDDLEDAIAYTQDFIDDWATNISQGVSILREDRLVSLIRLYKYSVDSDVEADRARDWFVNFADQEPVNHKLIGNYKRDYKVLKKSFDDFVSYEKTGVA